MILLAGLGFGDEGKGAITDFLANEIDSKSVVRYNGGPQAAHHVVKNGQMHCFSQFSSGTFKPGLLTYLSKYMLVDPFSLYVEEKALRKVGITDGYKRLFIDKNCIVITPYHKIVGRMREVILRYGSCGLGVGEAINDDKICSPKSLRMKDLLNKELLRYKLNYISAVKKDQAEQLIYQYSNKRLCDLLKWIRNIKMYDMVEEYSKMISKLNVGEFSSFDDRTIFEGAQGVLLDPYYGFWPYVTKTKTTFDNAYKLTGGIGFGTVGVIRAYLTRHGMGPFVSEDKQLTFIVQDLHNGFNEWQQDFRLGWFDTVAIRYSIRVLGGNLNNIALTNLDRLECFKDIKVCTSYEYCGKDDIDSFFDYETISGRKIIHDIKVQDPPDLKKQYRLKNLLYNCKPVFTDIKNWNIEKYIDFLESEQITPIRILSAGLENKHRVIW